MNDPHDKTNGQSGNDSHETNPFDLALKSADSLDDPTARSVFFSGTVKALVAAGRLDDALKTVDLIPFPIEKRSVLVHLATGMIEENDDLPISLLKIVQKLLAVDGTAAPVVGRLAHQLIDKGKIDSAVRILAETDKPFEGERSRHEFLVKLLDKNRFVEAETLLAGFIDPDFADWGRLALARGLAKKDRLDEARDHVKKISSEERRAWAVFELSRAVSKDRVGQFLLEAGTALESLAVEPSRADSLFTELRIVGKALFQSGEIDVAERLLERAEATSTHLPLSINRFRARLFLAKVLKELGMVDSVQNYFDLSEIDKAKLSFLDRSRVFQELAEATQKTGDWTKAICETEHISDQLERAKRAVEILRRFAETGHPAKATGEPAIDAIQLSAEEFEEHYFSPFAIDGCNCPL